MKVKDIINIYRQKNKDDQPLIIKVLDSITNFGRKISLRIEFKKIKEVYDAYIEETQTIFKEIATKYCDELNKENKDRPDYKNMEVENIQQIPPHHMPEYTKRTKDLRESDIKVDINLKLTLKEIEMSRITITEIEILDEFIDFDSEEKPKKKTKKVK